MSRHDRRRILVVIDSHRLKHWVRASVETNIPNELLMDIESSSLRRDSAVGRSYGGQGVKYAVHTSRLNQDWLCSDATDHDVDCHSNLFSVVEVSLTC